MCWLQQLIVLKLLPCLFFLCLDQEGQRRRWTNLPPLPKLPPQPAKSTVLTWLVLYHVTMQSFAWRWLVLKLSGEPAHSLLLLSSVPPTRGWAECPASPALAAPLPLRHHSPPFSLQLNCHRSSAMLPLKSPVSTGWPSSDLTTFWDECSGSRVPSCARGPWQPLVQEGGRLRPGEAAPRIALQHRWQMKTVLLQPESMLRNRIYLEKTRTEWYLQIPVTHLQHRWFSSEQVAFSHHHQCLQHSW